MIKLLAPLFLALAVTACAGDTMLSISGLETGCTVDKDCVAVDTGDACACLCGNAAINVADLPTYTTELQARQQSCVSLSACDCAPPVVSCNKGQCAVTR